MVDIHHSMILIIMKKAGIFAEKNIGFKFTKYNNILVPINQDCDTWNIWKNIRTIVEHLTNGKLKIRLSSNKSVTI